MMIMCDVHVCGMVACKILPLWLRVLFLAETKFSKFSVALMLYMPVYVCVLPILSLA